VDVEDNDAEAVGHAATVVDAGPLGALVLIVLAPVLLLVRRILRRRA
jgi:hypothetical protein